jgi:hypothetical protein
MSKSESPNQISLKDLHKALTQKGKFLKGTKKIVDVEDIPDPVLHKYLSFIKSGLRVIGCGVGIAGLVVSAFFFFLVAEAVGILEEMV